MKKLDEYLKVEGLKKEHFQQVIDPTVMPENTIPAKGTKAFDAVANGRNVGVFNYFYDEDGAEQQMDEASGSCHRHFRTREQADAFIEDWKESVTLIYKKEIKKALDQGERPLDMKFDISGLFQVDDTKVTGTQDVELQLGKLNIKDIKLEDTDNKGCCS